MTVSVRDARGVPFLALVTAEAKKRGHVLLPVAIVFLLGRGLDSWMRAAPPTGESPAFPLMALTAGIQFVARMGLMLARRLGGPRHTASDAIDAAPG